MQLKRCWIIGGVMLAATAATARAQHSDLEVARTDDPPGDPLPQLALEGPEDILNCVESIEISPGEGLFEGYFVNALPGWESIEMDEPDEGVFTLLEGHQAALKRISFSNGFGMFDPFSGDPILTSDGATVAFPQEDGAFHIDLIYAADPGSQIGDTFTATYQIVDLAGLHADSEEFTPCFEVVPEPGAISLLAVAGLLRFGRRRSRVGSDSLGAGS